MRRARLLLAVLALAGLTGCFDVLEELWINADGSARLLVDVALPDSLLRLGGHEVVTRFREEAKRTEAELEQDPNVTKFAVRDYAEAGMQHFVYELEVKDATQLQATMQKALARAASSQSELSGLRFDIAEADSGGLRFTQRLAPGGASAVDAGTGRVEPSEAIARDLGKHFAGAMLGGRFFTVRVHGPAITETNGVLNEEKTTAEWKIPLADLAAGTGPSELRAKVQTGAPLWLWAVIIGVPALLLMLAVSAMKRRSRAAA